MGVDPAQIQTANQAAEALAAANRGDGSGETSGIVHGGGEPAPAAEPATPGQTPDGPPAPAESFTSVDPGNLQIPEDPAEARQFLQQRYQEMQAHFTQRTQEAAPWAKLGAELGVDPAQAAESVRFAQALQADPEYALAVHGELTRHLQGLGMTPQQAQQEAASRIERQATDPMTGEFQVEDEPGFGESDPRIAELMRWKAEMDQQRHMEGYVNMALAEQARIQEADPSLTEGDWERIWAITPGVDGDVRRAPEMYTGFRNDVISGYIAGRSSVPVPTPSGGSAQQPEAIHTTEEATQAAAIRLAQELSEGSESPGIGLVQP
jgi:hypothetical protein